MTQRALEEAEAQFRADCRKYQGGLRHTLGFIKSHRNLFTDHIGAHFLVNLHEAGNGTLDNFAARFARENYDITLTPVEETCLQRAALQTNMVEGFRSTSVMESMRSNMLSRRGAVFVGMGGVFGLLGAVIASKDPVLAMLDKNFDIPLLNRNEHDACEQIILAAEKKIDALPENERTTARIEAVYEKELCDITHKITIKGLDEETMDWAKIAKVTALSAVSGFGLALLVKGVPSFIAGSIGDSRDKTMRRIEQLDDFCETRINRSSGGVNRQLNTQILHAHRDTAARIGEIETSLGELSAALNAYMERMPPEAATPSPASRVSGPTQEPQRLSRRALLGLGDGA